MKLLTKTKVKSKNSQNDWTLFFALGFFTLLFATSAYALAYNYWYQEKIFPGIYVASLNLGGLNESAARSKLNKFFYQFEQNGLNYQYLDQSIRINANVISPTDPDLAYELISFKNEASLQKAKQVGRTGWWWQKLYAPIWYSLSPKQIAPEFIFNQDKLKEVIQINFSKNEKISKNASLKWGYNNFILIKEENGQVFDYQQIIKKTKNKIINVKTQPIILTLQKSIPTITLAEINRSNNLQLEELANRQPTLVWKIDNNTYIKRFAEYRDNLIFSRQDENKIVVKLDNAWLFQELEKIKEKIDQPSQDAKFSVLDGRVKEFQQSRDGKLLDIAKNISIINSNFTQQEYSNELKLEIDRAKIQTTDVNSLGISEIIGIGTSDFSGSPPNRIHNIKVGADSLNGLLIKPGEEFSLLKALLPIDKNKGYLPELVIKGNETVPEYGGGLCQIGTTAFRAALATGVPITQRRNHSYRVSYYEPAGTDATIYDPAPDFRFLNNTPGHILIQTKIDGSKLIFEYWGTSDGRRATSTSPRIYNITSPPPTKYIETLDLEPGQIKCTERAHHGADAEFTYIVTFPNGEINEKIFTSHYRPWQEVCLQGVAELSSSTDIIIQ